MSRTLLGGQIDIHGGGSDLLFPHHENEIAQAECATGLEPFCGWWMHNGMLQLDGVKMSKSLGNLVLARNLMKEFEPDHLRLYLLSHHYRTERRLPRRRLACAPSRHTNGSSAGASQSAASGPDRSYPRRCGGSTTDFDTSPDGSKPGCRGSRCSRARSGA